MDMSFQEMYDGCGECERRGCEGLEVPEADVPPGVRALTAGTCGTGRDQDCENARIPNACEKARFEERHALINN